MAKNHIQEGDVLDYVNTGSAIASGDVVVLGSNKIGVALGDIAAGATGSVAVEEVYLLPKTAGVAMVQGAKAYWDSTPGEITNVATGNVYAGYVFAGAASGDASVAVKLNQ